MSEQANQPARALIAIREAFDRSFAEPVVAPGGGAGASLIAVRLAGTPYALRLAEVRQLERCPAIVALPAAGEALLGLTAMRGETLAVYDLAAILGHARVGETAWIVRLQAERSVAVAFEGFEGYLAEAGPAPIVESNARALVSRIVGAGREPIGILHLPAVLAWIEGRVAASGKTKEQTS